MFATGIAIFTGVAILLAKLKRRYMLRALSYPLAITWPFRRPSCRSTGVRQRLMGATSPALLSSLATSAARRMFGYIESNTYRSGPLVVNPFRSVKPPESWRWAGSDHGRQEMRLVGPRTSHGRADRSTRSRCYRDTFNLRVLDAAHDTARFDHRERGRSDRELEFFCGGGAHHCQDARSEALRSEVERGINAASPAAPSAGK